MTLNGKTVLASALTVSGSILAFGFASPKTVVQCVSIGFASVIIVGAFIHDALLTNSREKTIRDAATSKRAE